MKKQFSLNEFLEILDSISKKSDEYNFLENSIEYTLKDHDKENLIIPKIFHSDQSAYPSRIKEEYKSARPYLILVVRAGEAILAVCSNDELVEYKILKKYMVRKSQGKAQYNYLQQKGKSRLGSRIRLQQTEKFFSELNEFIKNYEERFDLNKIYLSCSPRLKGAWWKSSKEEPFDKNDKRIARLSLSINEISKWQLDDIIRRLTRAYKEKL